VGTDHEVRPWVALAGGVGAARFLQGLVRAVPPGDVTAIVNTGDDCVFYGVHVAPDCDIVSYTLSGRIDPERGFGLAGDSFVLIDALERLGHQTWFRLGDRDYAHCLHRTLRLAEGAGLAEVTDDLRRRLGVDTRVLPMSEDPCPTFVLLGDGRRLHFEEYLVREGAPDNVRRVDIGAAEAARPGPGVLAALGSARGILVCPSNPVVSIGPILAVPGVRNALLEARAAGKPIVAISPIVGGMPVKGPAAQLLRGVGCEVSARGVAERYCKWISGFVIDERDAGQAKQIEELGIDVRAVDTIMRDAAAAERLAGTVIELCT
jgi:LPPG:FO 2-phospho-L-lactate transferase